MTNRPRLRQLAAQAGRYLLIGGGTTGLQLLLVWLLTAPLGATWAFVLSWVVATGLSTWGHRIVTFVQHAIDRRDQLVGYATALAGLGLNTGALQVLEPATGAQSAAIVVAINTAIGTLRFVILRLWFLGRVRRHAAGDETLAD